ncbi:MAG TPA: HAMP domain-containing sensor histidine kinase [Gemmatimonadaceae bacterium]|nr:HAMP domain-containing sensor histidine kinase [Gemmatimonadaceae bacterium]
MTQPLTRIRLRLTVWYAATFGLILVLLGGGLFTVIRSQITAQLDASLEAATQELIRAANIREMEAQEARGQVVDAVDELHIPDRQLYLLTAGATPFKPAAAPEWATRAGQRAAASGGDVTLNAHVGHGHALRIHATVFTTSSGTRYIALAAADRVELEDRYASLIGAFGGASLAALLLVALGGWVLMRKSTAPVEATMAQMRRFMADAAHELRTPIAVLRTRAEVALQREREPAAYIDTLSRVEDEAKRLGVIVGDLLTLAHADAGEWPVAHDRLFLDDIALDAADAAHVLARQRGVTLEVGAFEESPIIGDRALVRQLLMQVLDNAVKFTPQGGRVRVDVSASNGTSTVVVADTGIGIPASQIPHVFDRFYRAENARERAPGAGLGLSIARWIATAHSATVSLDSTPGVGTTVVLTFPRAP